MRFNKNTVKNLMIASTVVFAIGCSKDEDPPAPKVTTTTPSTSGYSVPATYAFEDGTGASTVDFSGQQQRLEMADEMIAYIKSGNTLGTFIDATTLKNMYANNGYTWIDAPSLGLTGSTKQLKDKTAAGDIGIQTMFENYMDSVDLLSNLNYSNSAETYGQGGVWTNGTKSYLQSGAGYEYKELLEKGLMCAVFMNQMTVNYLGTLNDDDNTALVSGKNYTEMQHHWDEAYGYFTSEVDYPTNGTNRFWGKYTNSRESVLGSATILGNAFRKGRAAIDNKDYATRDAQIIIIRNEMERVCAGTAISYLNKVKASINNPCVRNHELSEAKGLIDGLRYGYNAISSTGMTTAEIDTVLSYINDFENITISDINNAIDLIASKTGLTSVKASL
ncbi:MAG: DUF4856 domain-containing protein [Vicingus serpentipes]|nr:DUF4856 domain-containing protein [Vicingus serpentipes]